MAEKIIGLNSLKRYDQRIKGFIYNEIESQHTNKGVLQKLSEDIDGNLLYNGKEISGGSSGVAHVELSSREW